MNIIYGIYRCDGELIYVGQTKNFDQRKISHLSSPTTKLRKWMAANGESEVEFRILGMYEQAELAKAVEAGIINALRPPMNDYCAGEYFRSKYIQRPKRGHAKLAKDAAVDNGLFQTER